MEKRFNNDEQILGDLISDVGLESPSNAFDDMVMQQILDAESKTVAYKPLIPRNGWIATIVIAAFIVALVLFLPSGDASSLMSNPLQNVRVELPEIKLSSTVLYATLFMGLFLIQMPLLKRRFIDNR